MMCTQAYCAGTLCPPRAKEWQGRAGKSGRFAMQAPLTFWTEPERSRSINAAETLGPGLEPLLRQAEPLPIASDVRDDGHGLADNLNEHRCDAAGQTGLDGIGLSIRLVPGILTILHVTRQHSVSYPVAQSDRT